MDKLAYTIDEAAELIGATKAQIRDLVTSRRIRHSLIGKERGVRFTRAQLEEFLERNAVEVQQ